MASNSNAGQLCARVSTPYLSACIPHQTTFDVYATSGAPAKLLQLTPATHDTRVLCLQDEEDTARQPIILREANVWHPAWGEATHPDSWHTPSHNRQAMQQQQQQGRWRPAEEDDAQQQEHTVADSAEDDPSPWLEAGPEQQDTNSQPRGLQSNTAQLGVVDQAVDGPTDSRQEAASLLPLASRPLNAAVQQRRRPQPDQPTACAPPHPDPGQPLEHTVRSMHAGCLVADHVGPARANEHPAASAQQPVTQHVGASAPAQHVGTSAPPQHATGNQATAAEEVLAAQHANGSLSAWHARPSGNSSPNEQQLAAAQAEILEQVALWLQRGGCVALCNRTEVPEQHGLQLMLAGADSPLQLDAVQDSAGAHAQTSQPMPVLLEATEAMQVSESLPAKRKREAETDLVCKRQRLCGRLRRSLRSISHMLIALWVFSKFHSGILQHHE